MDVSAGGEKSVAAGRDVRLTVKLPEGIAGAVIGVAAVFVWSVVITLALVRKGP